jgi:hypothetical protein
MSAKPTQDGASQWGEGVIATTNSDGTVTLTGDIPSFQASEIGDEPIGPQTSAEAIVWLQEDKCWSIEHEELVEELAGMTRDQAIALLQPVATMSKDDALKAMTVEFPKDDDDASKAIGRYIVLLGIGEIQLQRISEEQGAVNKPDWARETTLYYWNLSALASYLGYIVQDYKFDETNLPKQCPKAAKYPKCHAFLQKWKSRIDEARTRIRTAGDGLDPKRKLFPYTEIAIEAYQLSIHLDISISDCFSN